ncbi:MAG TPA: GNAT family N-acetyltransferase [Bacillota bacterium]|nr:GNAT family N-acetyltransferase [Bacillota bacterium]
MKFLKDNRILDIREAKTEDAEELLELLKKVGGETDFLLMDANGVPLTVEQERTYLENNLKSVTNKTFVAIVENKIIASSGIHGSDRERIAHNVTLGISILKDFWNLGVGTYLMEYIINYCRMTKTIKNIMLEVREDNKYAIGLYEKMGFKYVGKYLGKIKINDVFYNELIYQLVL